MPDKFRVTLCIDALGHEMGGIGRYTRELMKHLPEQDNIAAIRYFAEGRLIDDPARWSNGERVNSKFALRRATQSWLTRKAMRSSVVHAPNYFLPRNARIGVVTIHDLSVFRYPETHPVERVRQFEELFRDSLKRACRIITDTQTVRDELIEDFNVPGDAVSAVPLGVSSRFRPDHDALAATLQKWGLLQEGYGLCVSALEPRKKISELLNAWGRIDKELRGKYPLVLAGGGGWMNDEIHQQVRSAVNAGWLRHLGHVDDADLPRLYAGAALFVYPSTYEGFGLPPIEAMASGVPVIVANRSCLPEVCGDAARYVDPDNDDEFLTGIVEALSDEVWRAGTIQRGLERAALYTWDKCAAGTAAVYAQAFRQSN